MNGAADNPPGITGLNSTTSTSARSYPVDESEAVAKGAALLAPALFIISAYVVSDLGNRRSAWSNKIKLLLIIVFLCLRSARQKLRPVL